MLAGRKDPSVATPALADLKRYGDLVKAALPSERPDDHESAAWIDRALAQGAAIAALADGDNPQGLRLLAAAADAEAALPQPFGPPILAKPSAELLGDAYLAMKRSAEAAEAYRRTLAAMPNRSRSLSGLAKLR